MISAAASGFALPIDGKFKDTKQKMLYNLRDVTGMEIDYNCWTSKFQVKSPKFMDVALNKNSKE